jgi:hypothetical protein
MAALKFVCPGTGNDVDTGIDLDAKSFAGLPRDITTLSCPHCNEPHLLTGVQEWLGDIEFEHQYSLGRSLLAPGLPKLLLRGA